MATLFVAGLGFFKYYIDAKIDGVTAKIDPISKNMDLLIQFMVAHQGKIERLDERTEHLKRTGEK